MEKLKEVKFRLKETEQIKANLIAKHYGITINALAKHLVLNLKEPKLKIEKDIEYKERLMEKEISKQVGSIGNNINQIAKQVNTNSNFMFDRDRLLHELRELRNDTRELAGKPALSKNDFEESYKNNKSAKINRFSY